MRPSPATLAPGIAGALAAMLCAAPAAAQVRVGIRAGAAATSTLVRDSVVQPLSVRPGIAPCFGFTLESVLNGTWRLGLALGTAWSSLVERTPGAARTVVSLTTWTPTVSLSRSAGAGFTGRFAAGAVIYDPDHRAGTLFAGGTPPLPLLGAALAWERPARGGMRYGIELGYEAHWFTTRSLRDQGFEGQQAVHRVTLSVSASRVVRD